MRVSWRVMLKTLRTHPVVEYNFMRFSLFILLALLYSAQISAAQPTSDFAHQGEGAFRLLKRNGIHPSKVVIAEFREMNEGKFTSDGGLRKDIEYVLPIRIIDEQLFGEKYRQVDIVSDVLKNRVFYLISGHGGADPGAIGERGELDLYEDEYAYDVMLRFGRAALAHSATVYFISQDDDGIRDIKYLKADHDETHRNGKNVGSGKMGRLKPRVDEINRLYKKHGNAYQRVVEFHVDYFHKDRQIDVDFYYGSRRGKELAERLRETIRLKYKTVRPGRGYKGRIFPRSWYTLVHAIPVTAYIELGNINHKGDQVRIIEPNNRQTIAEWLLDAFIEDVKSQKK